MIKLKTVNNDDIIMQELVLLHLFVFGVHFKEKEENTLLLTLVLDL